MLQEVRMGLGEASCFETHMRKQKFKEKRLEQKSFKKINDLHSCCGDELYCHGRWIQYERKS